MLGGRMPNTDDISFTEPTTEIRSPIVHAHSSLLFNSISLIIICNGTVMSAINFMMHCPMKLEAQNKWPILGQS